MKDPILVLTIILLAVYIGYEALNLYFYFKDKANRRKWNEWEAIRNNWNNSDR